MMTRLRTFILLCWIGLSLVACGNQETSRPPVSIRDWKTFETNAYRIKYPAVWSLDTVSSPNVEFLLLSPLEGHQDQFRENVSFGIRPIDETLVLNDYATTVEAEIGSLRGRLVKEERMGTSEIPFHSFYYTVPMQQDRLAMLQHIWVSPGRAFTLTFSCQEHRFETYEEVAQAIMDSFTWK